MARRKQRPYSPGQMSLENLPGFWVDRSTQYSCTNPPEGKQPSLCSEKIDVQYDVEKKMSNPDWQESLVDPDNQMTVYVGTTFEACQGIREVKQQWLKNTTPRKVVFDCTPLELATKYTTEPTFNELFELEYRYLIGRGGLLNNSVFVNLLRCHETLIKWSEGVKNDTSIRSIVNFDFIPPCSHSHVGKLWSVLGMPDLIDPNPRSVWSSSNDSLEFQSRLVTPLLIVNSNNRNTVLKNTQKWLDFIVQRIGEVTNYKLFQLAVEVVTNLVNHGNQGIFGVSVWPSGQIEIIWSNPIDHLASEWPPDDDVKGLAQSLLNSSGGGMTYIFEELLARYKGVLIINWKTYNLIFGSAKDFSITGLHPRVSAFKDDRTLFPQSILFHLHLFCEETKNRSYDG